MFQKESSREERFKFYNYLETGILANSVGFKVLFAQESKLILSQKVEVVDEQMWTGSSSRGGRVTVCEHAYICVYIDIYTYIHTYIVPLMILPLFIKYCEIQCFLSRLHLPLFTSWKKVNMSIANMKQTAGQKHLKVCLSSNLEVFPLHR